MTFITPLCELREKIDAIDQQILQLINQRASYAIEVARTKIAEGEQGTFYRPDRESLILRRIIELNPGPLSNYTAVRFFKELMSACLSLEKPMEIAFLGPEGTFTQQAAIKHFGHSVNTVPAATINEIFNSVEIGSSHFGVVPVENSTEGVISHTLDRFLISTLKICGEVEIRVHQNLMGQVENLDQVTDVFSHQQSLAQCRQWLDKHLPHARRNAVSSNAEAARLAAADKQTVAIAGIMAAEVYNLNILEKNIEDEPHNTTRFIIIGPQAVCPTGNDKTSLVVSTGNQPGALHQILEPFALAGIGMVHIESRPSRQGLWDYVFFIDIEGHSDDKNVAEALEILKGRVNMIKLLGSYPKAVL
ncbi:Chorismate mutase / Prephenate dehydratase [Candidatus Methylobacter favarea]|uniref:Bifunctional chorismate mutase/prephenate dehydratase n=1 Tax=Candidatus Methylobacter favarea TaxID=2707345 RepID=A0A8S0Y669_9GAMM|nr:prephenate dehydratase [Candidatus Methylobacter favarea]CAA9890603.1 Chorismate mutase / Prephenate dehydratase [Candidatus Methylobacter favarea]